MKKGKIKVTPAMLGAAYDYLYRFKYAIDKKDETWVCFSKANMAVLYRRMRKAEHK